MALLTSGITPSTSNGGTSTGVLQDLADALSAVDSESASELFVITSPTIAKHWSMQTTADGAVAFPGMGPMGGQICNLEFSSATPWSRRSSWPTPIRLWGGSVELDRSLQADLQLDSVPSSPPDASASLTSLWQHDPVVLKATRYFCAVRLGATVVAVVDGVSYSGNTPA